MPGGLDSFLNVVIPISIFVFFGFMVYKNFKTEIDSLIAWIREKWGEEKAKEAQQYQAYYNPYLTGDRIVYQ